MTVTKLNIIVFRGGVIPANTDYMRNSVCRNWSEPVFRIRSEDLVVFEAGLVANLENVVAARHSEILVVCTARRGVTHQTVGSVGLLQLHHRWKVDGEEDGVAKEVEEPGKGERGGMELKKKIHVYECEELCESLW